ncbi:MAG: D-alanyl-D-alanine carboxypeptidase family protein [Nitrospiraceae bacterium]
MSLSTHYLCRINESLRLQRLQLLVVLMSILATLFLGYSISDAEPHASSPRYSPQKSRFPNALKPLRLFPGYRTPAESILLKDQTTGRILYEFESDRRLSPASLTKIMTALVILEHGDLNDLVTVGREAAAARKIRLRLKAGQVFQLGDLVKAMLITSANDACLAAALHVGGGTEEQFVRLMNDKALALGLVNTRFSNACGFDAPEHYTTAHDLAALSEIALQHPVFRAVVKEEREVINAVNTNRSYLLRSTNRLLGRLPGIEGVKTGFTSKAGRCLIAKVSHDGKELLLVLLHANRRWNTATHLINYGLQGPHVTTTALR